MVETQGSVVVRGGRRELITKGMRILWGLMKTLGVIVVVVICLCDGKFHVHLKMDNFTICELYLSRPHFKIFSIFGSNLLSVCSSL